MDYNLDKLLSDVKNINNENKDKIKSFMLNVLTDIKKCKILKQYYIEKTDELKELNNHFNEISELIKEKLNIDKELLGELINILQNWSNDVSFKKKYSLDENELKKMLEEQGDILKTLKNTLDDLTENLDTEIPDITNYNEEQLKNINMKDLIP